MKAALTTLIIVACGLVFADNWQLYDNFASGTVDGTRWASNSEFGGVAPAVVSEECVLAGVDTDGGDAALSSIYALHTVKAVKAVFNITSPVFNNEQGQGQTGDFEMSFYADLNNDMFCSITLFDSGTGLYGNAKVEDSEGVEIAAGAFDASYGTSATYAIEIQQNQILFKKGDSSLLSWQPSQDLSFTGFSMSAKGLYCTFNATIDDVYISDTPEYGNTSETAYEIIPDGVPYYGSLETSSDNDWFVFTPAPGGRYKFRFYNSEQNWKYINFYQEDQIGNLVEQTSDYAYNSISEKILFFELDYQCYFKISGNAGNYYFTVEHLDNTGADSYSNECSNPTAINIGDTIIGTLDHPEGVFDIDWLTFATQPLHRYRVTITRTDNSDAYFQLRDTNCGTHISSSASNYELVSWFGENYDLAITGSSNRFGHYYTINVLDLGLLTDDSPNSASTAAIIATDGSIVDGIIQYQADYHSDEDWFRFTPIPHSRYSITLTNSESNWKYINFYRMDSLGNLIEETSGYAINSISEQVLFLERNDECYIKISGNSGQFSVSVEYLDTTSPDSYSNSCSSATPFAVGNEIIGTLDHPGGAFDIDWFVFNTQPLHRYSITITKTDNSDAYFQLHNANCGYHISSSVSTFELVSWFGESYNLAITGSPNRYGHYYALQVMDLGAVDDDLPNSAGTSLSIPKDGTWISGTLQYTADYHSDEDWFKLIAPIDGVYQFKLKNDESNWKYMNIYKVNELEQLVEVTNTYAINSIGTVNATLNAGTHYIKISGNLGAFEINVLSPEPRCGDLDHPYPMGDVNQDCYFNMLDIAMMATDWLSCTDPNPPCEFSPQF